MKVFFTLGEMSGGGYISRFHGGFHLSLGSWIVVWLCLGSFVGLWRGSVLGCGELGG